MSVVDDIKARLDIIDVIGGYVSLQKAGRNFKALCPFHQEKTPSFVVFPDTQSWRCFGACGEGGDLFGFVMKMEGWDFRETLHEMARRAGVDLEPRSPAQQEQDDTLDRLRGLLDETARFFHQQLIDSPAAQVARDYVIRRGLSPQTAGDFVIGYAPDDWRQALHHLQMLGYSQEDAVEAGVATRNDKGNVYDRFRHRLVIPIRDSRGRTVGFGARALDDEAKPKYLNSPQGPLFDKSNLLYGLDTARRAIREYELAVIVEGYMDVIQAYQAGFTNVVAQMGTALTEEQLRQLARYAKRLVLALDPDTAGINATMRGLQVAQQTLSDGGAATFDPGGMIRYTDKLGIDIRVASLPAGQDPDDLIRSAPQEWEALIDRAVPVAEYVIQQQTARITEHTSHFEREQIARTLLPILTATESDIGRNSNLQSLARRVRIDERTLLQWSQRQQAIKTRAVPTLREQRKMAERPRRDMQHVNGPPGQSPQREKFCMHMLLQDPDRLYVANRKLRELQNGEAHLADVLAPLSIADFSQTAFQVIFSTLEQALYQADFEPVDYLVQHLPPELNVTLEELKVTSLETFQQGLAGPLATDFKAVMQEKTRINAVPKVDNALFIREVLALRLSRLERERREIYFMQQDEHDTLADHHFAATLAATTHAHQLIFKALQQIKA